MARNVLGNDPFLRGAAQRTPAAAKPTPAPQPSVKNAAPEAKKKSVTAASKATKKRAVATKKGRARPPVAHAGSPVVREKPSSPVPHPESPIEVPRAARHAPVPHEDSPFVKVNPSAPVPHPESPVEVEAADHLGPVPHEDSPGIRAKPSAPVPHAESPIEIEGSEKFAPVPHEDSPGIRPGPSAPVPHPESPVEIEVSEKFAPVPHEDSPAAQLGAKAQLLTAVGGAIRAARVALGLGTGSQFDVWGKDLELANGLGPVADFLYQKYWRVTVEGAALVPSGPCLLIANHSGALPIDGPMLHSALRRERPELHDARWLVEDQIFHAPFLGALVNRLGAVRANPENALRLLERGHPVIVFPEGVHGLAKPFSERYQLKRFGRGGFVKLAVRSGVPIVPVAVVGAEESMPVLARLPGAVLGLPWLPLTVPPLPSRWFVRFGSPIDLSDAPESAGDDLSWVQRANDRTREAIEGMLTSLLRARPSVF